jgi:hypothetical protein
MVSYAAYILFLLYLTVSYRILDKFSVIVNMD